MSLTFESAVESLSAMFPEWDKDALGSILISNQGRVETTIESILIMEAGGCANALNNRPTSSSGPSNNPADIHLNFNDSGRTSNSDSNAVRGEYRGTKCDLPTMFLRLPNYQPSSSTSRILADEELALMLQNEMFQRELMQSGYGQGGRTPFWENTPRTPSNNQDLAIPDMGIVKGLSTMGEVAKRNLSNVAMRFIAAMESQGQHNSSSSSSASDGRRVKQSEMKPLVGGDDDDDEDEIISFEDTSSDGRGHFLNGYDNSSRQKNNEYWTQNPASSGVKKDD